MKDTTRGPVNVSADGMLSPESHALRLLPRVGFYAVEICVRQKALSPILFSSCDEQSVLKNDKAMVLRNTHNYFCM